ncbi:MAG: hypothetical protein ACK47B_04145 [Armatimonadota bacterium]
MHRSLAPLLLVALVSGCRGGASGPSTARKMGPTLTRLTSQTTDPALPKEQREAYWERMKGRILTATGKVVSVSDSILLECPLELEVGQPAPPVETACVRAFPEERYVSALPMFKKDQPLRVQGVLTVREERPEGDGSGCRVLFEVREARILIR